MSKEYKTKPEELKVIYRPKEVKRKSHQQRLVEYEDIDGMLINTKEYQRR